MTEEEVRKITQFLRVQTESDLNTDMKQVEMIQCDLHFLSMSLSLMSLQNKALVCLQNIAPEIRLETRGKKRLPNSIQNPADFKSPSVSECSSDRCLYIHGYTADRKC